MLRKSVLALLAFTFLALVAPAPAAAQSGNLSPEQLRENTIRKFKEWREGIPDYEYRLYERVRNLNREVIIRGNFVIITMLVLFAAGPFWFRFVLNRSGGVATSGHVSLAPGGIGSGGMAGGDGRKLAKLKANQLLLGEMLTSVEDRLRSADERLVAMTSERAELKAMVSEIRRVVQTVEADLRTPLETDV
jgi:hypothetical protein